MHYTGCLLNMASNESENLIETKNEMNIKIVLPNFD